MSTRDGFHHSLLRSSPYSHLYLFFSLSDLPLPSFSLSPFFILFPYSLSVPSERERKKKKDARNDRSSMSSKTRFSVRPPYFSFKKSYSRDRVLSRSIYKPCITFIRLLFIDRGPFRKIELPIRIRIFLDFRLLSHSIILLRRTAIILQRDNVRKTYGWNVFLARGTIVIVESPSLRFNGGRSNNGFEGREGREKKEVGFVYYARW